MNSIIFSVFSRFLWLLMIAVSLYVLWRGHNDPGGGFVGGLIAATGFAILALAQGIGCARRALRVEPMVVVGTGLLLAIVSGLPGLLRDGSFLQHQWLLLETLPIGTALLFDIGVYLVVLGSVLALVLRFYEGL